MSKAFWSAAVACTILTIIMSVLIPEGTGIFVIAMAWGLAITGTIDIIDIWKRSK